MRLSYTCNVPEAASLRQWLNRGSNMAVLKNCCAFFTIQMYTICPFEAGHRGHQLLQK